MLHETVLARDSKVNLFCLSICAHDLLLMNSFALQQI